MSHTPGPWRYGQNSVGQTVIWGDHPGIPHPIEVAIMDERRVPEASQIRDDNAALIVAAPRLLNALYDCAASLAMYIGKDAEKSGTLQRAHSVIAEAEGQFSRENKEE